MPLFELNKVLKGGRGSGDFGHVGRAGKRGGSGGGGGKGKSRRGRRSREALNKEIEKTKAPSKGTRATIGDSPYGSQIKGKKGIFTGESRISSFDGNTLYRIEVDGVPGRFELSPDQYSKSIPTEQDSIISSESKMPKPKSSAQKVDDIKNVMRDKNIDKLTKRMQKFRSDPSTPNADVISNLSKNSDVDERTVEKFISMWNGGKPAVRFAVAESVRQELGQELGMKLSPYEKKNNATWLENARRSGDLTPKLESDYRKIARVVYDDTQKQLKDLGSSEVVLHRGIAGEKSKDVNVGDVVKWNGNSLDSWTTESFIANMFADDPNISGGMTIKSSIPANRIFSIPSSGIGTSEEREFVIWGNGPNDSVQVSTKN